MYGTSPNLVIGFHGCDLEVRDKLLLNSDSFEPSRKPYNWLGDGIYFWENNPTRAMQWAEDKQRKGQLKQACVMGAVLDLNNCCDLLNTYYINVLRLHYDAIKSETIRIENLPKNIDPKGISNGDKVIRYLDYAIIENMHLRINQTRMEEYEKYGFARTQAFDSVRAGFIEGVPVYEGASIHDKTHIQICIRNPNCILGLFAPRKEVDYQKLTVRNQAISN
ncbi:hypothetical protein ECE50_026830 [Chitinophaga sp. Mgbs1]|uniref:DUF3990 domain-containing protein n=1 Tax=Chitinophaga solisilvae TaxID=1233460 RepID=A0A9Q5DE80_9BACT|nr:hypothetical protein [Chitinophaga solisilvae]